MNLTDENLDQNSDQKVVNESLLKSWSIIKDSLNMLSIFTLERLIESTQQSTRQIQDKNVIFLIGRSGSGKTTIMLRLLQYQLKVSKIHQLKTLVPISQLKAQHKALITSPQAKSMTKHIFTAKINPNLIANLDEED